MKIVGVMLLSAILAGYTVGDAFAATSPDKDSVVQTAPSAAKKSKSMRVKKRKPSDKVGAIKASPKPKQDSMTQTPSESADQSVQLRGVRG